MEKAKPKKALSGRKSVTSTTRKARVKALVMRLTDTPLPEIAFVSSFILSRWWLNSDFSYPGELIILLLLYGSLAGVAFFVYRFILGPGLATHLAALGLSYFFYGYKFIHDHSLSQSLLQALPDGWTSPLTSSLFLMVVAGLAFGLAGWGTARLVSRSGFLQNLQVYKVLLFAVLFMFSFQVIRFADRYTELRPQLDYDYSSPMAGLQPSSAPDTKPDIYYIVFDRYGNDETLKQHFGFDNSQMANFLKDQGFSTRRAAYANYPFTMSSISSTMALDYHGSLEDKFGNDGKWQSAHPYRTILNDPPVAGILKSQGYEYNQVSSWWDFTRVGIKADKDPAKSFRLRVFGADHYLSDLQRDVVYKSILSPWLKKGISIGSTTLLKYDLDRHPRENFEVQVQALSEIAGRDDKSRPQYTFAHFLAPHPPYVFAPDGSDPGYDAESNDNGVDETVKYTNSVSYVNKRLKEIIIKIKQETPDAVIILQADEGPYPKQFRGKLTADNYYDPLELPDSAMKQKFGIQASYRLPGLSEEEAAGATSSVNIFRFVLNEYLGYSLPMLPECYLSVGNKFNIYSYELVNQRLTGVAAPEDCGAYE